ncbi:MAG: threonylcarbamoyl-AMP synthase [Chitinophagales bacterium]|nr:threonylcarbamoyl-AMP synthase [Bacteroidota bacterium]MCB9255744.1 threonylcarbamoyl-AMP synthase [Chitinophagales bacterium]
MKFEDEIERAAIEIENGGCILCPTDTIWGISADAENYEAVERVFALKLRPKTKSMIVLVSDRNMLEKYVESIPKLALELLEEKNTPSSIIYPKSRNLAKNVPAENGSVAIRIVQDDFCRTLIQRLAKPIISTSANLSGEASPSKFSAINSAIKTGVDYCVKYKSDLDTEAKSSSIYLIEDENIRQLR